MAAPPEALRLLLAGAVDYAGLFPPASLSLRDTVARYGTYGHGPHSWALGRLVLPAERLIEVPPFLEPEAGPAWDVSVLIGPDVDGDLRRARDLDPSRLRVAALEGSAAGAKALPRFAATVGAAARDLRVPAYVELPLAEDCGPALDAVRNHGLRAKARTGGVTAAAIPDTTRVLGFMAGCFARQVPFKVTAGLHHAVRGNRPLTYERDSPYAPMHGFLNVCVAAALLATGTPPSPLVAVLEETDARAFRFDDGGITWREHRAGLEAVHRARERLMAFGSCSFEEPVEELQALGLA
jgi:hypothetical protein